MLRTSILTLFALLLTGCLGMPENVQPVTQFELERYLGKWYEIARLDHSFEKGLENVTATYTRRDDGGVAVLNRGFDPEKGEWREAEGKAYFVDDSDSAYLKVSFFGPFYGSYIVFELDKDDYQYAFVAGPDHSYLWLLARTVQPPKPVIDSFLQAAQVRGFDLSELVFVAHAER